MNSTTSASFVEHRLKNVVHSNYSVREIVRRNIEEFFQLRDEVLSKPEIKDLNIFPDILLPVIEGLRIEQLKACARSNKIQLAFCGENSSGKTAFLHNFLGIGKILPSGDGPVTARITKLTYASPLEASIRLYNNLRDQILIHEVDLSSFFTKEKPEWMNVGRTLMQYTKRPDGMTDQSSEFDAWARCLLEIRIPSSILALGIDVFDTPGFLFDDAPVLKEILHDLVELFRPTIIFLYANPSTDDGTRGSFLAMKTALHDIDETSIFFLNSKADIQYMPRFRKDMTREEFMSMLDEERAERYALLLTVPFICNANLVGLPNLVDQCPYYDICSVNSQMIKPYGPLMNERVAERIIRFVADDDMRVTTRVCQLILPIIDAFFQFFHLTHNRTAEQLLQLKYDGMSWSKKYFDLYKEQTERFLIGLFNKVSNRLDTQEQEVLSILKSIKKPSGSLVSFVSSAINLQMMRPAIREVIKESLAAIMELIRSTPELHHEYIMNDILIKAFGQQEISDFAALLLNDRVNKISVSASILYMVNSFAIPTITCAKSLETKTEEIVASLFGTSVDETVEGKNFSTAKLTEVVKRCISMIREKLKEQKNAMQRAVTVAGERQREILESLVEQVYAVASPQLVLQQETLNRIEIHTPRFITIECELRAAQDMARFPGQTPTLLSIQNQSHVFSIFLADWGDEKNLVVKKLTQLLPDQPYAVYYEAHRHVQVAKLQLPCIINLRYLYNHQLNDGSTELWMIFPSMPLTLQQFLNNNQTLIPFEQVLEWMIRVASVLATLHDNERAHCNVTVSNIVLDDHGQSYLMDFGDWNGNRDFSLYHHPSFATDRFHDDVRDLGQMSISYNDAIQASLLLGQHIKNNVDRTVKEFQDIHRGFFQTLRDGSNESGSHENISTFLARLSPSEGDDLESNSANILNSYNASDRPALVVFGPNSSGKTSFIQRFLSIGKILPTSIGPVTARIVHLSYASQEQAAFYVYDSVAKNVVVHRDTLAPFFVNRTEPDWSNINQRLSPYVKRPSNYNANSAEFFEWAKCLVEIRLPSPVLQLGIDLYDTPGFLSEKREELLSENLHQLVKQVRPTLLFLYENATINETERSCFLAMKNAVNGLERVPVFFLNTKADCTSIANDFMLDDDLDNVPIDLFQQTLLEKRQRCYDLLQQREEMANEVLGNLPSSIEQCICFDICTTPPNYDPWENYTTLINDASFRRIVEFAVKTFSMPILATANDLLVSVDNYSDLLATTTPRPAEQWKILRDEALKWGETFFKGFTELMPDLVSELMNNIQQLFERLKRPIAQRAAAVERRDDPIDQLLEDNAKTIRQYLQLAVREQIIKVATNQTIVQQRDIIRDKISIHFQRQNNMRKNEVLTLAQRHVLGEISTEFLENTDWLNSILDSIMKLKMGMKRFFCSLPSKWHSLTREKLSRLSESQTTMVEDEDVFSLLDSMDAYATLSNENNRRLFSDSCLTKLAEEIQQKKPIFTRNLTIWTCEQQHSFKVSVDEIYNDVNKIFSKTSSSNNLLQKFSGPLARIECQILAVLEMSKHNGVAPIIDGPIGQGGFYSVYAAHCNNEQNLAIKKLTHRSSEHEQMMVLEIHYHRLVTRLCSEYVAPLLYVHENALPDHQNEFWILMPRYCRSLQEYLKVSINHLSFEQCVYFALAGTN
ncbi:unnamed protein product [Adineta ricciae]|uniref:Dynamin N-terminal domain-containing protein n=1 Tax=Adineta ricciae TaxID=249248 RepID=A0A815SHN5_ADIRI|nr:unnamed protein product [Adineta ricciae]